MVAMAGVNMRLEAGAIRELHWHKTAEVSNYNHILNLSSSQISSPTVVGVYYKWHGSSHSNQF